MFMLRLLLVSVFLLIVAPLSGASVIADQFIYPIDPWTPNCNGYWGTCNIPDAWHLGVDIPAPAGTPVYAVANGVVKHVNIQDRYGYVVIIEHVLASSEKVCSVYGHLKSNVPVSVNQLVSPGTLVGYLGTKEENGGWEPHLHIAIKKGQFSLSGYNYTCDDKSLWGYGGYTWCSDQKDTWYDPEIFIAQHQSFRTLFHYPDFSSIEGLNLVGSTIQGILFDLDTGTEINVLQLTDETQLQTGAAWFGAKQQIANGFETAFTFWISRDGAT